MKVNLRSSTSDSERFLLLLGARGWLLAKGSFKSFLRNYFSK